MFMTDPSLIPKELQSDHYKNALTVLCNIRKVERLRNLQWHYNDITLPPQQHPTHLSDLNLIHIGG